MDGVCRSSVGRFSLAWSFNGAVVAMASVGVEFTGCVLGFLTAVERVLNDTSMNGKILIFSKGSVLVGLKTAVT